MDIQSQKSYLVFHDRVLSACGSELCSTSAHRLTHDQRRGTGHSMMTKSFVEVNLKRLSWHILISPFPECDLSQCAQSRRKRKGKRSTAQISVLPCYHINSLNGNGLICK
jgi:hypothetical protein